ncbi:MAG: hypothetical protein LQ347_000333 [Umbilicaria vellea]|nr:MAG: hypothetical protein LQ347_000333 [Umbilicaria vellea]
MCYPEEAPIRQHDHAITLIEDDLTFLADTDDHMPDDLPPAFLDLNSATIDIPGAEANALSRQQLETLLPITSGISTSQPPPYALQQDLQTYFFYIASPQVRNKNTKHIGPPSDASLRRLLRSLPPRLTLASWVSKMLVTYVAQAYGLHNPEFLVTETAKVVISARTSNSSASYMSQPRFERLRSDLEVLPQFMTHLTVKFAEWLPFELQMLDHEETPEEARVAFRNGDAEYLPNRRTPREPGEIFMLYVSHTMDFLETRGWFDLPFASDVRGMFHDSLDRYRYAPGE